MTTQRTMVIVGGGLAGATAAETLRSEGFDGRVVVVGEEPEAPYDRPPLSKGYLLGETPRGQVYLHDDAFYREHDIELRTGTAVRELELASSQVVLHSGERLAFDRLLLATGATPHRLPVPGADLAGIHYLRELSDADALRQVLETGGRLVVVGAGWIGAEITAAARSRGIEVTVIDPVPLPLARVLGPEVGEFYRRLHARHGAQLRLGTGLQAFEGNGRVQRVRTTDGERIEADAVVVGVGVRPRTELAERAGLAVDDGVLVDEFLRTSHPAVFAAGDVARVTHPFYGVRLRVEHWATARDHGAAAARAMLDRGAPYDKLPYFFSDQYDVGMEYRGRAVEWDRVVFRGDPDGGEFLAFWLAGGRVLAGMNVNVWDVGDDVEQLIRSRAEVDPDRLADPAVPLAEVPSRPAVDGPAVNGKAVNGPAVNGKAVDGPVDGPVDDQAVNGKAGGGGLLGGFGYLRRVLADRFTPADPTPTEQLAPGEGRVLDVAGQKVAVYKDPSGELHGVSPVCTHARCLVEWHAADTAWGCPCHGARYAPTGEVLRGPAKKNLAPVELPASPSTAAQDRPARS